MTHFDRDFFENEAKSSGYIRIAGVDEVGRGPLAGPVVAACCVLSSTLNTIGFRDSKKLSDSMRRSFYNRIMEDEGTSVGIGIIDETIIDELNILQATLLAMQVAVSQLVVPPDFVLIDGNQYPQLLLPMKAIVGGDDRSYSIAAASIIAKVTRDDIMDKYHYQWPEYGFHSHKGYGTAKHTSVIREKGPLPIHRFSFEPVKSLFLHRDYLKKT